MQSVYLFATFQTVAFQFTGSVSMNLRIQYFEFQGSKPCDIATEPPRGRHASRGLLRVGEVFEPLPADVDTSRCSRARNFGLYRCMDWDRIGHLERKQALWEELRGQFDTTLLFGRTLGQYAAWITITIRLISKRP